MKLRCERDDLLEAVQFAARAITNRATLPVLAGLRMEATEDGTVAIGATDLELTMETQLQAAVDEPGMTVVPGRLFGDMMRSLGPGQVSLISGDAEIEISSGRGRFHVKAMSVEDYPQLPTRSGDEGGIELELSAETLAVGLSQVVRSASGDETRQVLTGVLWEVEGETLTLAATDSYRLSVRELSVSNTGEGRNVVLPARALSELARTLQGTSGRVSVELKTNFAVFRVSGAEGAAETVIASRFIEGEFPKYRQLLPQGYPNTLVVERSDVVEVVKRVGLLAQNNMPVKFQLGTELEVSANTPDVGEGQEILDAEYEGEAMVIAFNPRFFLDGATAISGERLTLVASDGLKPAIMRAEGEPGFTYLLMPVRLS
jgi:DNA polymerase III subunit beta